jgi:signal transduction histidine kinase
LSAGMTAAPATRTRPERPILLVVDDEPEVLRSVFDLFRLDYRVLTAERGPEALGVLQSNPVSVIMSDQRMPEMTGVEFLGQAKVVRPEATRLLFTGYADIKAVIDAINQGHVFRYVAKPWDPEELGTVIRQAIEHHDLIVEKQTLINELKQTNARLAEANRLKGAFIEVASHELNTPVAVILGMTELWKITQGESATSSERGWVDRIHASGRRLAGTVERMLKLLWADHFDAPLDLAKTDIESLIRGVVDDLKPYFDARKQSVAIQVEPDLGSADIDAGKIADALTNLIVNAIKFTPDGQTITIAARPLGPNKIELAVSDPGVGICAEDQAHIYEPFFTGYDTMHHSSGDFQFGKRGIGLGLPLVKSFVELHGGSISLESEIGKGTTFRIQLPRHVPSNLPV